MKFLCYTVYDGNPEHKDPVGHCAMGEDGFIISTSTFEDLKTTITIRDSNPELLEGCGWIIDGEQQKLQDPQYTDLLKFNMLLREARLAKEQENDQKT